MANKCTFKFYGTEKEMQQLEEQKYAHCKIAIVTHISNEVLHQFYGGPSVQLRACRRNLKKSTSEQ